ncbi:hypothetical protein Taro_041686, partial [Colocasia esculenta]|nr:hypothetical protein [Colocasia esculenta]
MASLNGSGAAKSEASPPGGCQLEHTRSPEYSLNRLPRMGVPGNGNNLSHGTSPQVPSTERKTSVDHTRELAQVPRVAMPYPVAIPSRRPEPSRPGCDTQERRDLVATGQAIAT